MMNSTHMFESFAPKSESEVRQKSKSKDLKKRLLNSVNQNRYKMSQQISNDINSTSDLLHRQSSILNQKQKTGLSHREVAKTEKKAAQKVVVQLTDEHGL